MYKYAFYLMMYMLIVDILEMLTFLTLKITMYLKVQPLWKTVWSFLKKLKAELPCDQTNPIRGHASG